MIENLRRTPTSGGSEAKGVAFGLRGNLAVPIFIAAMGSAALAALIIGASPKVTLAQWLIIAAPTALTSVYVVFVKNRDIPRFEQDLWERALEGADFNSRARKSLRHPVLDAAKGSSKGSSKGKPLKGNRSGSSAQ